MSDRVVWGAVLQAGGRRDANPRGRRAGLGPRRVEEPGRVQEGAGRCVCAWRGRAQGAG